MLTYAITNQQPFLRTWRRDRYPDKSDTPELADFNVAPELENHHTDGRQGGFWPVGGNWLCHKGLLLDDVAWTYNRRTRETNWTYKTYQRLTLCNLCFYVL